MGRSHAYNDVPTRYNLNNAEGKTLEAGAKERLLNGDLREVSETRAWKEGRKVIIPGTGENCGRRAKDSLGAPRDHQAFGLHDGSHFIQY